MFVALPTGSGKSICFSCLPLVFDTLRATGGMSSHHSIVATSGVVTKKNSPAKIGPPGPIFLVHHLSYHYNWSVTDKNGPPHKSIIMGTPLQ